MFVIAMITLSSAVAAYEAIDRLIHPPSRAPPVCGGVRRRHGRLHWQGGRNPPPPLTAFMIIDRRSVRLSDRVTAVNAGAGSPRRDIVGLVRLRCSSSRLLLMARTSRRLIDRLTRQVTSNSWCMPSA